jgi:hypothetical protein
MESYPEALTNTQPPSINQPINPQQIQHPQKNLWKYISFILVVVLIGCISYIYYERNILSKQITDLEEKISPVPTKSILAIPTLTITPSFILPTMTIIPTITTSNPLINQQWKVYKDIDYKFQIEYPATWLFATNKINKELDKYDELTENHIVLFGENDITTISTYQFGRMEIGVYGNTDESDVEKWFEKEFKIDPSLPKSGYTPIKEKVFTTKGNIKVVQSEPYFTNQPFYFILNKKVVSVIVNFANDDAGLNSPKNISLKSIYEHMINTLALII